MALNILVVDDSRLMRSMVARSLRMSGLPIGELHEAANGKEGLDVLEREWIDIAFVDIHMPVMTGLEMIDRVRAMADLASLPIVVVSAESSQTRIDAIRGRGIEFVHKPFTAERMKELVRDLLEYFRDAND